MAASTSVDAVPVLEDGIFDNPEGVEVRLKNKGCRNRVKKVKKRGQQKKAR